MRAVNITTRCLSRYCGLILTVFIVLLVAYTWLILTIIEKKINKLNASSLQLNFDKDWHDYKQIQADAIRQGRPGEQGIAFEFEGEPNPLEKKLLRLYGYNALVSDIISLNRAVPDIRHESCRKKRYLSRLPTVSVVMIFHNEHLSVILRSLHSLRNRTPKELLHEIILVDDYSDMEDLHKALESHLKKNFAPNFVTLLRLPRRQGLIAARLAGARKASADVLVFLDAHIEATNNWLPPLLEPIAKNRRAVVCPLIDIIDHENFGYKPQDDGARGAFDWTFDYKRLPLAMEDNENPIVPHETPIMAGGLFAIARDFFWNLGGYDPGLDIWGGEQYELSFKIWMCGGKIYESICSRVGHVYRGSTHNVKSPRNYDYLHKNYKRVAEVWMDEYKQYLYAHSDERVYDKIDAGDLSAQKALRKKLQCKSFSWYLNEIAPDILYAYPPVWHVSHAYGNIQSQVAPFFCLDTLGVENGGLMGLDKCHENGTNLFKNQLFELSWFRDLRLYHRSFCLEPLTDEILSPVQLLDCHQEESIIWYYDLQHNWLRTLNENQFCLEAVPKEFTVRMNDCQLDNQQLRWHFSYINRTAFIGN